jgi:hypothetical protein
LKNRNIVAIIIEKNRHFCSTQSIEYKMNSEYKDIKTLISNLGVASQSLEKGELSVEDISTMLEEARELHERIAILQFQAGQPKVNAEKVEIAEEIAEDLTISKTQKGELNFSFDFSSKGKHENVQTEEEKERTNQTNLLDAIEEFPEDLKEEDEAVAVQIKETKGPASEEVVELDFNIASDTKNEVTLNDKAQSNQSSSINDKFADRAEQETLADRLSKSPIASLPAAIGLNQKFLFMNDLFEGENGLYNEAIQSLNNFTSFIDADEYVNTLAAEHNWDMTDKTSKDFVELVERRYS